MKRTMTNCFRIILVLALQALCFTSLAGKPVGPEREEFPHAGIPVSSVKKSNHSPFYFSASADITLQGTVRDAAGQPLAGVSIVVRGAGRGTQTDARGAFSLQANAGDVLVFTFVGFLNKEITVGTNERLQIVLEQDPRQLGEVIVTALGIKREKKSLGYSVTEVKGSDLTQARDVNVLNSLVGKVAGLNVNSIAGGPGASSNVIIRGISSLGQTNQPLYVINGIPIESQPNSPGGGQYDNAPDLGDAISNINPDDIESISVLKGAAASALYGYRAKAGVILITTKSGRGNDIELNSNYVGERVMDLTHWQYVYGQGQNNLKPTSQTVAFQGGESSWGGKLDGSPVVQFDGVMRPYTAQKNNLENFYRTGGTLTNTMAFNKSFEGGAIRFSASDLHNTGIIPNSGINRQTFNIDGNFNVIKRLTVDVRANYILEQAKNRPLLSDPSGNANYNVMFLPTSVDVRSLRKTTNADGSEFTYTPTVNETNPWFAAEKFINNTTRERLISSVNLRYSFDNGAFIQGRVGRDAYNDTYLAVVPTGTAYRPFGSMTDHYSHFTDLNADVLAGKTFHLHDFTLTPNIGGSYRRTKSTAYSNHGETFAVPFVYNITNTTVNKTTTYIPSDEEVQSAYATLELAYKDFLFLNGSTRSDWFSTLATPVKNNKLNIFYPSVSGSFVFTEFLKNDWLNFGRIRVGYAEVGQATTPYQTQLSYSFAAATFNGHPQGTILNTSVPNASLVPSLAKELEIGTELRFFHERLNLDVAWYNKKSTDEILQAPASIASGYGGAVLNIGELRNKGFEFLVTGQLIKATDFTWTSSVNASVNDNEVISLAANQASLAVGTSSTAVGFTQNIVGLAADQVMAYDYKYDSSGKKLIDASGVPSRGALKPYGSAYARWVAGFNNEFRYKRFTLSFLIDGKFGGKIFSATDYRAYGAGLAKATLVNREGVFGNNLDAATYYSTLASNISSLFVEDASFIKFRQLIFGYTFPGKLFNGVVKGATISLVGRNLFYLMKKTGNIDPESDYTPNAYGLELGGVPPARTFGFNLNVKF
jgi:TonB-linked SusC/RagA family outer membrane protein